MRSACGDTSLRPSTASNHRCMNSAQLEPQPASTCAALKIAPDSKIVFARSIHDIVRSSTGSTTWMFGHLIQALWLRTSPPLGRLIHG